MVQTPKLMSQNSLSKNATGNQFFIRLTVSKQAGQTTKNLQHKSAPAAKVGSVGKKIAYFLQEACQEDCCDLVAALVGVVAKTSPSDQAQFQFFHETAPAKNINLTSNNKIVPLDRRTVSN